MDGLKNAQKLIEQVRGIIEDLSNEYLEVWHEAEMSNEPPHAEACHEEAEEILKAIRVMRSDVAKMEASLPKYK